MKTYCALITASICLIVGSACSQAVLIDSVDGTWTGDGTAYIEPGEDVVFYIRMTNNTGDDIGGMTNGFRVYGPASFDPVTANLAYDMGVYFDLACGINVSGIDGAGADTVGFYGAAMFEAGIPDGFDSVFMTIATRVDAAQEGSQLCLDSASFPPSGVWRWAPSFYPDWSGPVCYEIKTPSQSMITITNCVADYTGSHCDTATFDFEADNPPGEPMTWEKVSGVGEVDPETGIWTYIPSLSDVTELGNQIEVRACGRSSCSEVCHMHLYFTNEAPVFTDGLGSYTVTAGSTRQVALSVDAVDCDDFGLSIVAVDPAPAGSYGIEGNTLTFNPDEPVDAGKSFDFTVIATDGKDSDTGTVIFEVTAARPFEVQIQQINNAYQGVHQKVDVVLNAGTEKLAGFDLLISYDATALIFAEAEVGGLYDCGWEYFTYRQGQNGACGSACPDGMIRVVGIAETNNGAHHPDFGCYFDLKKPFTLFSLDFLVTNDRTFECMHVPIRFFWMDCGDNSLAYHTQEAPMEAVQAVSRFIYQYEADPAWEFSNLAAGFPTYTGVQEECLVGGGPGKPAPVQYVDFVNGGISIVCADSIDARGDVNLNGEANEIADAVLFSNYFIFGLSVLTENTAGQVAATDTNADGMTLTVADLVYLIRVVVGDALPYTKLSPVVASYSIRDGTLSVDQPMGAAFVVVSGQAIPKLETGRMDMRFNFDGEHTRILISSFEPGAEFEGDFLSVDAPVVSVELATYEGARVQAELRPDGFKLDQNYPNPFNPSTQISFRLPQQSDYSLVIYNIAGQEVERFDGWAEAGVTTVEWDASSHASGVYLYRLESEGRTSSRKMVLLK